MCARFLGNKELGKAINKSTLDLFGKSRKTKNTQPLLKDNAFLIQKGLCPAMFVDMTRDVNDNLKYCFLVKYKELQI